MWEWTLNWNEVRGDLLVGSCPRTTSDVACIRSASDVSAILSLQSDQCLAALDIDYAAQREAGHRLGLVMRRVPMLDFDPEDQRRHLARAVRALHGLLCDEHRVYVHCTAGMGRGPLVVAGYLSLWEGMPEEEALELVKRERTGALPSPEALAGCLSDLVRDHRELIEREAHRRYLGRLAAGAPGDALRDWAEAERVILARVVGSPGSGNNAGS